MKTDGAAPALCDLDTSDERALLLVRLAGLPARTIEPFSSALCRQQADDQLAIQQQLDEARAALVERLYEVIHGAPKHLRRFFLAVKRACYNGRPLERHSRAAEWQELCRRSGSPADRVTTLEGRLAASQRRLEGLLRQELLRERRQLIGVVGDRGFLRGVALASPTTAANVQRLAARPVDTFGRRERRLEASMLRYASRAALKLSPFSTLTRICLATIAEHQTGSLRLRPVAWRERSLLRLKRYLVSQVLEMLLSYPPFWAQLPIELNNSLGEAAGVGYRFLRSGSWGYDANSQRVCFSVDALVTLKLDGPLLDWLRNELPERHFTYEELVAALARELLSNDDRIRAAVGRLLQIGILCWRLPWPIHEPHLEQRLLEHLRGLDHDEVLRPLRAQLERLVELETRYPKAARAAAAVSELDDRIDAVWRSAAPLGGLAATVERTRNSQGNIFEDVFLEPANAGTKPELVRVREATVRRLLDDVEPIVRLSRLYDYQLDFNQTLAAWFAEVWPQRLEVGLLELFAAAQQLAQQYLRFDLERRRAGERTTSFNPLKLPQLEDLERWRQSTWRQLPALVETRGDEAELCGEAVTRLLARAPAGCRLPASSCLVNSCLMVQPADARGELWVLNRMYEGTGRLGSRFTAVMSVDLRRRYAARLAARSVIDHHGEPAELLDLMYVEGDTLNVHAPQTRRALEWPGKTTLVTGERKVSLRDLRIRLEGDSRRPQIVDSDGRRYLPVHLGGASLDYMPPLVKFLAALGPGELRPLLPPAPRRPVGRGEVSERLRLGSLVLRRRCWRLVPPVLSGEESAARAYVEIQRWRREHDLPERLFMIERRPRLGREDARKPQYLDLTSPSFMAIFRDALGHEKGRLMVEEMLPHPEAFPVDHEGRGWAAELMLESLALTPERQPLESDVHKGAHVDAVQAPSPPLVREDLQTEPLAAR